MSGLAPCASAAMGMHNFLYLLDQFQHSHDPSEGCSLSRNRYGKPFIFDGEMCHAFPKPSSISCGGYDRLKECRLGYRQPYVFGTSCSITNEKEWEETVHQLPYEDARKELMKLQGIGPKAADCILLFAFQKYEAFPVDIWIRRIMQQQYLPSFVSGNLVNRKGYNAIRTFAREHFGEYCGYAQEYLYSARKE